MLKAKGAPPGFVEESPVKAVTCKRRDGVRFRNNQSYFCEILFENNSGTFLCATLVRGRVHTPFDSTMGCPIPTHPPHHS